MSNAEATFVIIGAIAAALTVIGTYTWWVYTRGQESGGQKAEREANQRAQTGEAAKVRGLETQLAAIQTLVDSLQAEVDSLRSKRRRA